MARAQRARISKSSQTIPNPEQANEAINMALDFTRTATERAILTSP